MLLCRVGHHARCHRDASCVKNEPDNTQRTATELELDLALKIQKRDSQLSIAKAKINALNRYLREAVVREDELRAQVQSLVLQRANWKRTSAIVHNALNNADAFPPDSATVNDYV
jgi:hypothetical protein